MNLSFLPLLVSTFTPGPLPAPAPAEVNLLAALPAETFAVLHVPNPKAITASRETSRWVAFAMDAEWDSLLTGLVKSVDVDAAPEELSAWRERILGSLADSSGLVGFASGALKKDGPNPTIGLMVQGGEESSRLLRRFIGTDARSASLPNGAEVLLSELGRAELYYESNGLILLLSSATVEESMSVAEECLNSLTAANATSLFHLPGIAKHRPDEPTMEFAVDTSPFIQAIREAEPDMEPFQRRAVDSLASVRWVYSSFELGLGEEADWNFYAPYDEDSMIGSALKFFGEADKSLFANAPIESVSATVGAFDINGFATWVLGEIEDTSEEVHAQAVAGLSGIQTAIGVDLMTDIVGNMSGQFLGFKSAPNAAAGGGMVSMVGLADPTTLVALMEDTEPFLDMVESLLNISGMGDSVTSESRAMGSDGGEIELYRTTEDVGIDLVVGVGEGRVFLSSDPATRAAYFDLTNGTGSSKSVLDDPKRKKAVAAASGALLTVQPTAGIADVVEGFGEWADMLMGDFIPDQDPELNPNRTQPETSITVATSRLADLIRRYFSGTMTGEVRVGNGLMHMRTAAR